MEMGNWYSSSIKIEWNWILWKLRVSFKANYRFSVFVL
jgi:hypothetical protein